MYNRFCFSTIAERILKKLILLLFLKNKKVDLKQNVRGDFIKVYRCVPSIFIKFKNKKLLWNEMIVDKMKFAFAKTLQYIFLLFFLVSVISVLPCLSPRQKLHCWSRYLKTVNDHLLKKSLIFLYFVSYNIDANPFKVTCKSFFLLKNGISKKKILSRKIAILWMQGTKE